MSGKILDGRQVSNDIRAELRQRVAVLADRGVVPTLAGILVGEDAGSASYVRLKEKAAGETGLRAAMHRLSADSTQEEVDALIDELNQDGDTHGIFVQLPLPTHLREDEILARVAAEKDVDGFHPENVGGIWLGRDSFAPATPAGIIELLSRTGYGDLRRRHAVIVNTDNLVGKPLAALLLQERIGANVTLCHLDSPDMRDWTRRADLLVVSVNKARFITADMVKEGVIAVDFGTNYVPDPDAPTGSRLVGDIDFEAVRTKAEAITPVPGGLGPMTVTMLLAHTVRAAEHLSRITPGH